jgi:hypothetical protein
MTALTPATFADTLPIASTNFAPSRPDNDLASFLPQAAAAKFEALRYRAASLHALCIPFADLEEASLARLQAEQRLQRLQASPQDDGFNLPLTDPRCVAAQKDLAKATAALKLLNDRREARAQTWAAAGRVLAAIDAWMRDGVPGNAVLEDYDGPETKLAKGENGILDAIENRRCKAKELHTELDRIRSAPFPSNYAKEQMRAQIAALAQRGAVNVTALVKHDGKLTFPEERRSVPVIVAKESAVVSWQEFDALGTFCWLHQTALIDSLDHRIEAEADDKAALSHEERQQQEAEVLSELLAIEREEAALVWQAQAKNLPIEHRAACAPQAILGCRLVTAPRALPAPGSSPEHAFGVVGR